MKRSGSQFLVDALLAEGVDTVFGYPGGAVIPIFDALYSEPSIHVVLTRHEQAAVHAADGYARSTGKTGVCIVTSGPGATNTVTGLATANFDSVPIVCIAGQVPRNMIGNDAFQEADTVGITRPVTKHNYLVTKRSELGQIIKNSFFIASSGRPGPVVIDIPKDITILESDDEYPESVAIRGYDPIQSPVYEQITEAAVIFSRAEKPLFFIGGGMHIANAAPIFNEILEKTGVPVVSSLMGIGIVPSDHPDFLGMIGMHGAYAANMAVTHCDLLFSIGVRFDDRATGNLSKFAPKAKIVHIDIDPVTIARNVPVDYPIVGDAKQVLESLAPHMHPFKVSGWKQQIAEWKKQYQPKIPKKAERLFPQLVIQMISDIFPEAIITTEVGQNQMWASMFYKFRHPRTWLTSGGLGTMGYGFPAAIGAQKGNPGKRVIDIAGDGSIQMNIQELATAVNEKLPVIVAILNNSYLGMVRQWQEIFNEKRYSSTCLDPNDPNCSSYIPDFVALAKAYNAAGIRVHTMEEGKEALETAKTITDRPILIEFLIEKEANVFPMVPPGAGLSEMVLGEEE